MRFKEIDNKTNICDIITEYFELVYFFCYSSNPVQNTQMQGMLARKELLQFIGLGVRSPCLKHLDLR
jgi:hypothetical protein